MGKKSSDYYIRRSSSSCHLLQLSFFVVVPAIQEMETYEISPPQSVLDDGGSGYAGGGGGIGQIYPSNHYRLMKKQQRTKACCSEYRSISRNRYS